MLIKISTQEALEMLTDNDLIEKVFVKLSTGYHKVYEIYWYFGKITGNESYDGKANVNLAEFYKEVDDNEMLMLAEAKQKSEYDRGVKTGYKQAKQDLAEIDESDRLKLDKVDAELKCMPQGAYMSKGYEQGE